MTLETIDDSARLAEFSPEWSSFASEIAGLTPFQTPEWLLTWWRHFGSGRLHVLVFREKGAIVGVIPCFLHLWQGLRQMTLIGSGISDYLEPAIQPTHRAAVLEMLEAHLKTNSNWDRCVWQDLSADTPLKRMASTTIEDTPCTEISISGTFDDYWAARPKSLRQNVRRDKRKTESLGASEFVVTTQADAELVSALIRLHGARWREHGEPGMIEVNHSAAFVEEVARTFAARDMLRIFALRFKGKVAAVILGFCYASTVFNYLTAFDPADEALGLGRTLLYDALRQCFENGYRAWNFLRGDEPYKAWWGAVNIPKCRVIVQRTA